MQSIDRNTIAFRFADSLKVYEVALKVYKKDDSFTEVVFTVREGQVESLEDISLNSPVNLHVTVSKYIKDSDLTALFEWVLDLLPGAFVRNNETELRTYWAGPELGEYTMFLAVPPGRYSMPGIREQLIHEFAKLVYRTPRVRWNEVSAFLYAKNPEWLPKGESTREGPVERVFDVDSIGLYCLSSTEKKLYLIIWGERFEASQSFPREERVCPKLYAVEASFYIVTAFLAYQGWESQPHPYPDAKRAEKYYQLLREIGVIPSSFYRIYAAMLYRHESALRECLYHIERHLHTRGYDLSLSDNFKTLGPQGD